jgi:arylsulfatase A-like enzyme
MRRRRSGSRWPNGCSARASACLLAASLPLASSLPSGACAAAAPRPNVVIVILDAARADHFGAYGYARPTTPEFDALVPESLLFENAIADASFTMASVASLITGQPPGTHRIVELGRKLSDDVTTLAEVLRQAGFRTGAFTENPLIDAGYGYAQGFDTFRQIPGPMSPDEKAARLSDSAVARGNVRETLAWAAAAKADGPFFLYSHILRPHNPYQALPEHRGRFAADEIGAIDGSTGQLVKLNHGRQKLSDRDLQHLVDLYDENLLSADSLLGQLVSGLRETGQLDRSILVVMSDHGEAFREHGRLLHGDYVYQEDIHIPLLVRFPPSTGLAGRRVGAPIQISDLMPTLLSALGLPVPEAATGRDWMPRLAASDEAAAEDAIPAPIIAHGTRSTSLQSASWKLVRRETRAAAAPRTLLFDLDADPGEQRDLARQEAARSSSLNDQLDRELRRQSGDRPDESAPELAPEFVERLRALGYLPSEGDGRPSPESDSAGD